MAGKPPVGRSVAQDVPYAIPGRRSGYARITAEKRLNPSGETFRAWYACGDCKAAVDLHDRFCRNCGIPFWVPRPWAKP